LSSKLENNIIFKEKDWSEVESEFDLLHKMQIIIREGSQVTKANSRAAYSPWLPRLAIATLFIVAIGNIPTQSFLQAPNKTLSPVFAIKSNPLQDKALSKPLTPLSSTHTLKASNKAPVNESLLIASESELTLPNRAIETYEGNNHIKTSSKWTTYHVKSYDNLTNIFHKLGQQDALEILIQNKSIAKELEKITKNSIVRATATNENKLSQLVFSLSNNKSYQVILEKSGEYSGSWQPNLFETRQARASFSIRNGLFFDGRKSGIADSVIKEIVKVFDWDIDFSHDIRVNDKVTVVFEELYHDGDKVDSGKLLAAEFINNGHVFRAVQYAFKDGVTDYFTPEGQEMKKAFIRTPIAHARVSSHFNPGRFHPVLHKFRAHKGTDFAARRGTRIMATGNGVIKSLGRKGGYGRTIVIQHKDGYTTLYAHMSRYKKGLKVGQKIYQGDAIGYVGSSGLATGPHLHYEFRKNNKPMDSMSASLPHSMSLTSTELQDFRNKAVNLVLQLNVLHRFVKAKIDISSNIGG
jgi:murein DD-endopeptidase MepM/ murein hydrolase activator NlpD